MITINAKARSMTHFAQLAVASPDTITYRKEVFKCVFLREVKEDFHYMGRKDTKYTIKCQYWYSNHKMFGNKRMTYDSSMFGNKRMTYDSSMLIYYHRLAPYKIITYPMSSVTYPMSSVTYPMSCSPKACIKTIIIDRKRWMMAMLRIHSTNEKIFSKALLRAYQRIVMVDNDVYYHNDFKRIMRTALMLKLNYPVIEAIKRSFGSK